MYVNTVLRKLPSFKAGCLDKLVVCKLKLVVVVSQNTPEHMLPFLASELEALIWNITSRFIKPEVVKVCNTFTELANYKTWPEPPEFKKIDIEFGDQKSSFVTRGQWQQNTKAESWIFLYCQRFLVAVLVNLIERCLHVHWYCTLLLDKHAVALDPVHMPTGECHHRCWARVLNAEMEVENLKEDNPVALRMKFSELQSTLD